MKRFVHVLLLILAGSGMGFVAERFAGLGSVIGMAIGAFAWLAFETRRLTRHMKSEREYIDAATDAMLAELRPPGSEAR